MIRVFEIEHFLSESFQRKGHLKYGQMIFLLSFQHFDLREMLNNYMLHRYLKSSTATLPKLKTATYS